MVEVRFSEVHWYRVSVPKTALDEASGGRDRTGPADSWPDEVAEAVSALLTTAADFQPGSRDESDGLEVHSISPVR